LLGTEKEEAGAEEFQEHQVSQSQNISKCEIEYKRNHQ